MKDDSPAFPSHNNLPKELGNRMEFGMTLRDYFAAKSMALTYKFWMEDYYHPDSSDAEFRVDDERSDFDEGIMKLVADDAYKMADAMMEARK
jgi:hypothetical protein